MPIASTVVEIRGGTGETALGRLATIPQLSIYGIQENRIVAVIEGSTVTVIDDVARAIARFDEVEGVYPVYLAGDGGAQ